MLERLLAWFINNYIGEYFDNVNIDQLSIAYRQGEIELENLPLKPGALKNFGFPVDVKSAWIGKIKIRGSYRIRSEPWTVTIEDLHVVCVPLTSFEYDLDQEELNAQTIKYGVLECMENKWKLHSKSSQETSYYASSYWTWLSYSSSLITSILENIHFNISNLHIRYEDTLPNKLNVACGFLVKNVSAFSSDSDWMPKFVNRTESSNCMRKVIQLTDLSVYWDSDVAFVSNDNGDWVKQMHDLFDFSVKSDMSVCDHFYFLSPVKAEAFICRNFSDEFDSIPKPKITFDFKIDQFVLTISFRQYKQMLYCLSEFNRCQILLKNRKWRPKKSISDEPKAWWKYAINVNLQNWRKKNRRENWNFVLKRAKMLTKYSKVYSEFLLQPDNLAEEAKNFKEEVEYELEFEELFRLRDASCRLSHSKEIVDAHAQLPSESWLLFSNWIPSWVYTGSSSTMEETPLEIVDDFFSSTDWEDLRFVSISAQIDKAMLKIVDDYNVHPCDLLTAKMSEMNMYQQMRGNDVDGNTRLTISSDYYNRNLQLWEPLVEPWIIDLTWIVELQKVKEDEFTKVIRFKLCSHQVLVMNVTCMSIDLYTRLSKFFASDPSREMRREEEQKVFSESVLVHYHLDVRFEALNLKLLKSGLDSVDRMLALASINGFRLESVLNQSEVKLNSSIKYIKLTEDVCNVRSEIRTVASIGDDKKSENSTLQAVSLTLKRSYADNVMDITFTVASSYYMHSSKLITELASWASQCKTDVSQIAFKLKHTAVEVAKDLVEKVNATMRPKPIKPNPKKKKDNARVRKKSTVQDYRFEFHVDSPLVILPYSAQAIMDLKKLFSGSDSNLKRSTTVGSSLDTEKHISVGIEIKRGILKLIDDQCGSELPLLELKWPELSLWHKMRGSDIKGNSKVIFAMNYFNRVLSGWEPLVETFKFDVNWIISMKKWNKDGIVQRSSSEGSSKKFEFHISTFDILNINITSTLLDLYKRVKTYWDLKSAPLPISSGPLKNMPFRDLEGSLLPEPLLSPPTSWVPTVAAPEIDLQVILDAHGIGISLVNKHSEELIYASLRTIILEYCYTSTKHSFNCSVRDMQIDDQMHDSHKQVVMSPAKFNRNDPMSVQPALGISIQKLVVPSVKAHFFHEVQIRFKDFVFNLEEILLLKFYEFLGYTSRGRARSSAEVLEHQANLKASMANSWWLYLSQMEIDLRNVTLSVITTNPLPTDLVTLKRSLGLSLIAFEDASIQLEKFKRQNSLDTFSFLMSEIQEHYRLQLERQAARILISVDFLGNPLGLVTNVSDGISELITKGNVGGLVTNITHGLSNSTAKFMSTLSDSLDLATMDNRHQEIRRRIKKDNTDRIRTGLRGLGVGIMGGMTSILTHTYEGATNEGLPGLVSGFGRGLIGTITKPTVGMLDFATEAASAVRDTSKKILLQGPPVQRIRLPRVCIGPTGLLPAYDSRQAEGQQYFYTSTNAEMDNEEIFLSFDLILTDTACLITTETVRFLTWGHQSSNHGEVFLSVVFEDLIKCKPEVTINKNLAETMLVLSVIRESSVASYTKYGNLIDLRTKTLKVRCSSDRVAKTCADQINGAKAAYEVKKYKLM